MMFTSCVINHQYNYPLDANIDSVSIVKEERLIKGAIIEVGQELAFAIDGDGFFELVKPNGEHVYTRYGKFYRDSNGQICNESGYTLYGAPKIDSQVEEITVLVDGSLSVTINNEITANGNLMLANFKNPEEIKFDSKGFVVQTVSLGNVYRGIPGQSSLGILRQGFLEAKQKFTLITIAETLKE